MLKKSYIANRECSLGRICFFLGALLASFAGQGICDEQIPSTTKERPLLEIKGGYFFFTDAKMSKIYNKGGMDVQISGSYPVWKWLQVYGSIEYLERHGQSLSFHENTSIWELPVSVGLKPIIKICSNIQYYLALGPQYFYVHLHNQSPYVTQNRGRNGIGGFANMGFNFFPYKHLSINLFGEYSYREIHMHTSNKHVYDKSVQIGGFVFGGGLGYAF